MDPLLGYSECVVVQLHFKGTRCRWNKPHDEQWSNSLTNSDVIIFYGQTRRFNHPQKTRISVRHSCLPRTYPDISLICISISPNKNIHIIGSKRWVQRNYFSWERERERDDKETCLRTALCIGPKRTCSWSSNRMREISRCVCNVEAGSKVPGGDDWHKCCWLVDDWRVVLSHERSNHRACCWLVVDWRLSWRNREWDIILPAEHVKREKSKVGLLQRERWK